MAANTMGRVSGDCKCGLEENGVITLEGVSSERPASEFSSPHQQTKFVVSCFPP